MLPTKKTSKSRTRTRRAHHWLRPANFKSCPVCNRAKLPHAACGNCGFVNARIQLKQKPEES